MRFQNLAPHPDIGANSYLLEFGSTRIVLDAGAHPKHTGKSSVPRFDLLEPDSVDCILISHPHLDHIGTLPCLVRDQPDAAVTMTEATREFGTALLHNSVNVMTAQRKELNESSYPLYRHRELDAMSKFWFTKGVENEFSIGERDRVRCEFFAAGHVMGAVGIRMRFEGHTVFYTGDVHFENQTLTRAARFPEEPVDTLIVETTRGDSQRAEDYTRRAEQLRLGHSIAETLSGGGSVLIPVFAFGKTQEVLLMLKELFEEGKLPKVPVHIGGLSSKMTQIADQFSDYPFRSHQGYRFLEDFETLEILPRGRSEPPYQPGNIYALSSGMMAENTVSNRFARHFLNAPGNSIFFVGYADPNTPAGKILASEEGDLVRLEEKNGSVFPLKCQVDRFDFSGHAPREQILDFILRSGARTVILVHGDLAAKNWFETQLRTRSPGTRVEIPAPGQEILL